MCLKLLVVHVRGLNLVIFPRYDLLELLNLVELVIICTFNIVEVLAFLSILLTHVLLEVVKGNFKTLDILFT